MIETIGVIGGGQLGRMFALDAKRMGYNVIALDPQAHSPCGQVSDEQIVAAYDDFAAIDQLGQRSDVVTYEFENIAIASVQRLEASGYCVAPASTVLEITQNRLREKAFAERCGAGVAPFAPIRSSNDLKEAAASIGFPAVLKTVRGGYDGKGQWRVEDLESALGAQREASGDELIFERWIAFDREISIVATRDARGTIVCYPPAENRHDNGILSVSIAPARIGAAMARRASAIAESLGDALKIVGTFCVEFFVAGDDLFVNEIAPRPHNSGHYTIDATHCSQYEQHVRAICDLPLSTPKLSGGAIMVNILGTGSGNHLHGVDRLLEDPSIVVHLYGKKHAPKRRKMGHFTMVLDRQPNDPDIARALAARELLHWET